MREEWTLDVLGESFRFGAADTDYPLSAAPVVGAPDARFDDAELPRTDGRAFGRDFLEGRLVEFELTALGSDSDDYAGTRELVERFERVWRARKLRDTPGAFASLRSPTGRFAFGRPRHFSTDDVYLRAGGASLIECAFATSDPYWYSDERYAWLSYAPKPVLGLIAPLVAPLSTLGGEGSSTQSIDVLGTELSFPVLGVRGPITSPRVEIGDRFWEFPGLTISQGQTLWIDTQPWSRSILMNGSPRVPSRRSTPLSKAGLEPGRHVVALRGTSSTATAAVSIRWRDSWASY